MSEAVVDRLEVVEVEEQHAEAFLRIAPRALDSDAYTLDEECAIRQTGQAIVRPPAGYGRAAGKAASVTPKQGDKGRRHAQDRRGQARNTLERRRERAVERWNRAPLARQCEWRERGRVDHGFADHR